MLVSPVVHYRSSSVPVDSLEGCCPAHSPSFLQTEPEWKYTVMAIKNDLSFLLCLISSLRMCLHIDLSLPVLWASVIPFCCQRSKITLRNQTFSNKNYIQLLLYWQHTCQVVDWCVPCCTEERTQDWNSSKRYSVNCLSQVTVKNKHRLLCV